ncbi:hypothetical protein IID21_04590 [Patescibacteria group bacterium]|nr:hypothetical protein [Patescibacteria group bacterium]
MWRKWWVLFASVALLVLTLIVARSTLEEYSISVPEAIALLTSPIDQQVPTGEPCPPGSGDDLGPWKVFPKEEPLVVPLDDGQTMQIRLLDQGEASLRLQFLYPDRDPEEYEVFNDQDKVIRLHPSVEGGLQVWACESQASYRLILDSGYWHQRVGDCPPEEENPWNEYPQEGLEIQTSDGVLLLEVEVVNSDSGEIIYVTFTLPSGDDFTLSGSYYQVPLPFPVVVIPDQLTVEFWVCGESQLFYRFVSIVQERA